MWLVGATSGSASGSERDTILGPFLAGHWQLPIPAQGPPPPHFEPGEASLDPAFCGACHPEQLREWQGSLHASAYSPGLVAQLIEGPLSEPREMRACLTCHAPLTEQQPWTSAGEPNPDFDSALQSHGVTCAACHVRAHRRFGPAPQAGQERAETASATRRTHDGFEVRSEFEEGRFCAPCHQFFDDAGVNGKPIENTFVEWRAWQAGSGDPRTCQDCHMPGRSHRWQGIHDPAFVRAAVAAELFDLGTGAAPGEVAAALVLQSRDVGHALPTYVTPKVILSMWQVDPAGRALGDTHLEASIERVIDLASEPPRELADSRVHPGESVKLDYRQPRHPEASGVVAEVRVDPDAHYREVYRALAGTLTAPEALRLLEQAESRIAESAYTLFRFERSLPQQ